MWELVTFVMRLGSVAIVIGFGAICLAVVMNSVTDSDTTEGTTR